MISTLILELQRTVQTSSFTKCTKKRSTRPNNLVRFVAQLWCNKVVQSRYLKQ